MPKPIHSTKDSRTWVQPDGVGTAFELFGCHAVTEWSQAVSDAVRIKCKSADEYGKMDIVESIPGAAGDVTFTMEAWTQKDADFLMGLHCPVDVQVHLGECSSPSDPTGYTKIRHFYNTAPGEISESPLDFLGEEEYAGVKLTRNFTADDVIEVLQVAAGRIAVSETQDLLAVDFITTERCEGDCGIGVKSGQWGAFVAAPSYGAATANVYHTNDFGATWTLCTTDPFADNTAIPSDILVLPGATAPRLIVFRGNAAVAYNARCSVSDDWGVTWTEVDMGNGSRYINGAWAYSSGKLWAVGEDYVYYSTDRGASWTENAIGSTGIDFYDIHSVDDQTIYVCGAQNSVYKSTDGGEIWAATTTNPAAGTETLYSIQAASQYRALVGGEIDANNDVLWVTEDGGETWADVDFTGSTAANGRVRRLRVCPRAPGQHIWMIHGARVGSDRLYRTLEGGGTSGPYAHGRWERLNLISVGELNDLAVVSVNQAWAVGDASGGTGVLIRAA